MDSVKEIIKGAVNGSPEDMGALAIHYYYGDSDINKNDLKAKLWFKRSLFKGDAENTVALMTMYENEGFMEGIYKPSEIALMLKDSKEPLVVYCRGRLSYLAYKITGGAKYLEQCLNDLDYAINNKHFVSELFKTQILNAEQKESAGIFKKLALVIKGTYIYIFSNEKEFAFCDHERVMGKKLGL